MKKPLTSYPPPWIRLGFYIGNLTWLLIYFFNLLIPSLLQAPPTLLEATALIWGPILELIVTYFFYVVELLTLMPAWLSAYLFFKIIYRYNYRPL